MVMNKSVIGIVCSVFAIWEAIGYLTLLILTYTKQVAFEFTANELEFTWSLELVQIGEFEAIPAACLLRVIASVCLYWGICKDDIHLLNFWLWTAGLSTVSMLVLVSLQLDNGLEESSTESKSSPIVLVTTGTTGLLCTLVGLYRRMLKEYLSQRPIMAEAIV